MPRAAIDIGSNSLLLTVVDDAGAVLHDEARVVGLGRGLGDHGAFRPDRMAAAEAVLVEYLATAKSHGVEAWSVKAVATSAARRAMNAETFFARVLKAHGLRVKVVSGEEEARLTWLGAQRGLSFEGPRLVVDLGGGSTELVLGEPGRVHYRVSLEIGSVRLTEAYLGEGVPDPRGYARLCNHVDTVVKGHRLEPTPATVIAVAGTATTLMAIVLGMETWDAERVHGQRLSREDLARLIDRLVRSTPEQRRELARVSPERADYLLAGATVLDRVLGHVRQRSMVVSDGGLRFGLLARA